MTRPLVYLAGPDVFATGLTVIRVGTYRKRKDIAAIRKMLRGCEISTLARRVADEPNMDNRLLKAANAVAWDVCNLLCPSVWKTAKGGPPHHPKCVELRAAISEAIDENSYADLRASGGIVGAP